MLHYSTRLIVSGLFIAPCSRLSARIFPRMWVPQRNHEYHCPHSNRASSICTGSKATSGAFPYKRLPMYSRRRSTTKRRSLKRRASTSLLGSQLLALPRGSVLSSCGYPLHCFPERDIRRDSVLQLCSGHRKPRQAPTCGQRPSRLCDDRAVSSMMSTTCVGA